LLEHETDFGAQRSFASFRHIAHRLAIDNNLPRDRIEQADQMLQDDAFACPGSTNQNQEFSLIEIKGDATQYVLITERLGDVFDLNEWASCVHV
jgi:hypothetical protein